MQNQYKGMLSCLLAGMLLFVGCQGEESDPAWQPVTEPESLGYALENIALPEQIDVLQCADYAENALYLCGSQMDPETYENTVLLLKYQAQDAFAEPVQELTLLEDTLSNVVDFEVLQDGTICCLVSGTMQEEPELVGDVVDWDAYYENFSSAWQLMFYDADGTCTQTIDICQSLEKKDAELTFLSIAAADAAHIYINGMRGDSVIELALNDDGTVRTILPNGMVKSVNQSMILPDHTLILYGQDAAYRNVIYSYDAEGHTWEVTRLWPESAASPLSIWEANVDAAMDYYTAEEQELYAYRSDHVKERVLPWEEVSLHGADVLWGTDLPDQEFALLYVDASGVKVPAILRRQNGAPEAEETT